MNCGWDNLSDTTVCLKCGQLLSISTGYANNQNDFVSREGYGEAIPKPTVLNANPNREKCRKTVVFPTLNEPDTHSDITPHCSLTIIPEENENIPSEKMEYEGKSIILNRENTEVSNRTITSKEQAEIVFEDGHWYLLDRSELRTTFIQANRKIEIIPDDIIVLGDRRFKFESDSL